MIVIESRSGARVCGASFCHGLRHEASGRISRWARSIGIWHRGVTHEMQPARKAGVHCREDGLSDGKGGHGITPKAKVGEL